VNKNSKLDYGTAQLQGNVCMRPRCILHVFQTHLVCVPDASHTRSGYVPHVFWTHPCLAKKGAWYSRTSCCSFTMRFYACTDVSRADFATRPRRILHSHLACISDTSERYLGAELYCNRFRCFWSHAFCWPNWLLLVMGTLKLDIKTIFSLYLVDSPAILWIPFASCYLIL